MDPFVGILTEPSEKNEIFVTDTSTQPGQNTGIVENLKSILQLPAKYSSELNFRTESISEEVRT